MRGFPGGAMVKNPTCQCRRCKTWGFAVCIRMISWMRKYNPLQYSCLENSPGRRVWRAVVYGVANNWTLLGTHTHTHTHTHIMNSESYLYVVFCLWHFVMEAKKTKTLKHCPAACLQNCSLNLNTPQTHNYSLQ